MSEIEEQACEYCRFGLVVHPTVYQQLLASDKIALR
jgi:hypothetical protein